MNIDEAIKYCYEFAESKCDDCEKEHLQLAHWLEELKESRSLVKFQGEKIKEFDGKIVIQQGMIDYQKAEIEKLKNRNAFLENEYKNQGKLFWERVKIKQSEAIKEFAERLKTMISQIDISMPYDDKEDIVEKIVFKLDNLVKEMTEVEKQCK